MTKQGRVRCALTGAALLMMASTASAERLSGSDLLGVNWVPFGANDSKLLSAFYFRYQDTDHPLQTLALRPQGDGFAMVAMADRHPSKDDYDDKFWYVGDFTPLGVAASVNDWGRICLGPCAIGLTPRPTADSVFVLRGFRFSYLGDDHAVKEAYLQESGGVLYANFNDRGNGVGYILDVDYAWVPGWQLRNLERVTGTAWGSTQRAVPWGRGVVRGFSLHFTDDDYRVREIGVMMNQPTDGQMQVYFGDNSQSRRFSYSVDYAFVK